MKAMYTAEATARGGRNGHVKSNNDILDLQIRSPRAMGGTSDDYTNPEMLFAAGYSACFDSALNLVITQGAIETGETSVNAKISIGRITNGGFGLSAELVVNVPGVSLEHAQDLVEKAHHVCPYSNATRGNIEVKLTVTNN
jgi:Ohr subfamily peroxiredoxin